MNERGLVKSKPAWYNPAPPSGDGITRKIGIEAMNALDTIGKKKTDVPDIRPGDTVRVHALIVEGNRERVQVFQGTVIRMRKGGMQANFTVRRIASHGVGVERTFPLHSPSIAKLEIVQRGHVRRAKLYYLRDLRGKKARIKERRIDEVKLAAMEAEAAAAEVAEAEAAAEGADAEAADFADQEAEEAEAAIEATEETQPEAADEPAA